MKERPTGYLLAGLVVTSLLFFGQAGWIYAKAWLAQFLMESAWARTLEGEERVKPFST